mmetsp:Transcript_7926/g.18565  ORF Transcript_7926/g.18565 Transcript_7926/m.18565 type:complete len:348 (+) Transcript_7926:48-1091(+)
MAPSTETGGGSSKDVLGKVLGKKDPKTAKGRRVLRKREPKIREDPKTAMIIRGNRSSHEVLQLLRDLHKVRNPLCTLFSRKHDEHPFEDVRHLEKLCAKHDHSLFLFGSSSKKRPFRLILGRLFSDELLDMQEFSVSDYKPIQPTQQETAVGAKPLIMFHGAAFETSDLMKRAKSLLLDFFNVGSPDKVALKAVEHVIVCTALEPASSTLSGLQDKPSSPTIHVKRYRINLLKSGMRQPRVELMELGPSFKLALDRTKDPDKTRWKQSIKMPKQAKPTKVKNVSKDEMGKRSGRFHLGRQDFDQIHTVHHGEAKRKKLKESIKANTQPAAKAQKTADTADDSAPATS